MCRIATSRADADFAEVEGAATKLIAMIDGWIALEPVIAEAKRTLDHAETVPAKEGKRFAEAKICTDLRQLVEQAESYRPLDLDEVETKATLLQAQRAAVIRAEGLWRATIRVIAATSPSPELQQLIAPGLEDLPGAEELRTGAAPSPPENVDQAKRVSSHLDTSLIRLQRVERFFPAPANVPAAHQPALAAAAEEMSNVAGDLENVRKAATKADQEVEGPVVAVSTGTEGPGLRRPSKGDFAFSLVAGLGASIAYAGTIYSDTWGSFPEVASAVAAGFITPTLAWAALPIFSSVRWPAGGGSAAPAAATTTATTATTDVAAPAATTPPTKP
jgi:hypothetical protein